MGAYPTSSAAGLIFDNGPGVISEEWCMCEHFNSIHDVANYYRKMGGVTFLDGLIMCENCYAKMLNGKWDLF